MEHAHRHSSDLAERVALVATAACLMHCVGLPLVLAALPSIASAVPVPEAVHFAALLLAVPTSGYALLSGWRRHLDPWPLLVGTGGLLLLAVGVLAFGNTAGEAPVTVAGSVALVWAHIRNWRLRRG